MPRTRVVANECLSTWAVTWSSSPARSAMPVMMCAPLALSRWPRWLRNSAGVSPAPGQPVRSSSHSRSVVRSFSWIGSSRTRSPLPSIRIRPLRAERRISSRSSAIVSESRAPAWNGTSASARSLGDGVVWAARRYRICARGSQRGGVDLARDEHERLVRDRRDVPGHEPQEPHRSVVGLQVLNRALAISRRRQRVAARGLELLMARQLGDHHQIVAAAHQPGQARVPQRVLVPTSAQ